MIIMCFFVVLYGDNAYMVLLLLIDALVLVSSCLMCRSIDIYGAFFILCVDYNHGALIGIIMVNSGSLISCVISS